MTRLLQRLWDDDGGAVLSVELILILGILVFGIIAGIVALRNSAIAALGTIGNTLTAITPSVTYSGYAITSFGGTGSPIAVINGLLLSHTTPAYLSGVQVAPVSASYLVVVPAP